MVDSVVGVGFAEVLFVHRPGIVISMDWIHCDISTFDGVLDDICYLLCVSSHFFLGICPDVVWRVVASPKDDVGLDIRHYEVHHILKSLCRNVTESGVGAPLASGNLTWTRWTIFVAAAQEVAALGVATWAVKGVKMYI